MEELKGTERVKQYLKGIGRIVIKLGTSIVAPAASLDRALLAAIAAQVSELKKGGVDAAVVTSGAIGTGIGLLKLKSRPKGLPMLQASAAIGQSHLMKAYDEALRTKGLLAAQVLLTAEDLRDRKRYLNARNTILTLLDNGVVPVINENDTVSIDEIKFGDNDTLSALVANLIGADLLIILTDVDGFYHKGRIMHTVEAITPELEKSASGSSAELTLGGMASKLQAAKIVTSSGIAMVIADGRKENIIGKIIAGGESGTIFLPKGKLTARKRWLGFTAKTKGTVVVDSGAKKALSEGGKSLLASGIKNVKGNFDIGDAVSIVGEDNKEFARGLVDYSSPDIHKIMGKKTSEIEKILGYRYYDEVIHRDNMVVLKD
ncbi:MAG: glutamate 5-kinase [Candidatus Omnitrophota bacterium]